MVFGIAELISDQTVIVIYSIELILYSLFIGLFGVLATLQIENEKKVQLEREELAKQIANPELNLSASIVLAESADFRDEGLKAFLLSQKQKPNLLVNRRDTTTRAIDRMNTNTRHSRESTQSM